jgi:hypothetical protein
VPQAIRYDDELRIIEMTIVTRPFVLDLLGLISTYRQISQENWTEWEAEKQEQFGTRWSAVQAVLAALEELDIHMVDVLPAISRFSIES